MAMAEVLDPEDDAQDAIDLEPEQQEPDDEGETPPEPEAEEGEPDESEGEDDGVTVSIGDESPPSEAQERAPQWVKDLRKERQTLQREKRSLEAEVARLKGSGQTQVAEVGPEPTLEDAKWDEAEFKTQWKAWNGRKDAQAAAAAKAQAEATNAQKAWAATMDHHNKLKGELKVPDWDDAEAALDALSVTQRGLIVHGSKNSAALEYAIGKSPRLLAELKAIDDHVIFAKRVAQLEMQLKVTPRKTAPIPERSVRGNAPAPGGPDKQLDRLEAEADRTGDRTKVQAYKKAQKLKAGR